ncbi:hypothetical protein J6590_011102 [Homalodisca vitripennis]|nr:hypothetical protein J6590_011102 [Homalodisca vitripennis]
MSAVFIVQTTLCLSSSSLFLLRFPDGETRPVTFAGRKGTDRERENEWGDAADEIHTAHGNAAIKRNFKSDFLWTMNVSVIGSALSKFDFLNDFMVQEPSSGRRTAAALFASLSYARP